MAVTGNSTQLAQLASNPSDLLKPAEKHGRVRVASFSYTTAALTIGQTVGLCKIPAGATILGGAIAFNDIGNSISIGTEDNVTKYLLQTSCASANTALTPIAFTTALKCGQRVTSETLIVGCARSGTWTASKLLYGMVLYAID